MVVVVLFREKTCVSAEFEYQPVFYYFSFMLSSRFCQALVLFTEQTGLSL